MAVIDIPSLGAAGALAGTDLFPLTQGTTTAKKGTLANLAIFTATALGTVAGPASAVDSRIAAFDGTTGKLIKDGGIATSALLVSGGALGTPSSGVATNLTGTAAGLTAGNASALNGATFASPGAIGGTTSAAASFTAITVSGLVASGGINVLSNGTASKLTTTDNTVVGGNNYLGFYDANAVFSYIGFAGTANRFDIINSDAGGILAFGAGGFTPAMRLLPNGNFLIGTTTDAGYKFQVAGNAVVQSTTAIPAGGTAGAGVMVSSTANFGVFFGSGAPTLSAAKGSLYLRSDGSGIADRAYINTNGSTTWTALATAA